MADDNSDPTAAAVPSTQAPAQANPPVELVPDDQPNDDASELGQTVASSSTSISSSIRDYRVENGRTYHRYKDGKYQFPNDEFEKDRLDLQHNLWLLTLDNMLGLAPPNQPDSKVKRVLDVGTGTGIWAVEFGEEHPEAEASIEDVLMIKFVRGIDLSPSMPEFVPPNVKFEIDDAEEEWTYSRPFDYIFCRILNSCINDWKAFLRQALKHLTPGGYFELQEPGLFPGCDDGTLKADAPLSKCIDLMYDAAIKFGRAYQEIPALAKIMEEVGFVDVKLNVFKWPTNAWPKERKYKELGIWNNENLCDGFEAFTMAPFTRAHGWTREEVLLFLVNVRKDLKDRSIHAYFPIYSVYGRKPTEEETAE